MESVGSVEVIVGAVAVVGAPRTTVPICRCPLTRTTMAPVPRKMKESAETVVMRMRRNQLSLSQRHPKSERSSIKRYVGIWLR